jgi:hypothetical protein
MTTSHPLRLSVSTSGGNRGLFYLLPFAGGPDGKHYFSDHNHARNFVRYLFSQSKAHPQNGQTSRNLYREFGDDARLVKEGYNEAPRQLLGDFLNRRFPSRNAHEVLADDGCYPFFILQSPGTQIISNFVQRDGRGLKFRHALLPHLKDYLDYYGESWSSAADEVTRFAGKDPVSSFDVERDPEIIRRTEIFVQAVVRKLLGDGQQVVMTVAHRDQEDHNPCYHIHRLIRTSEEAPAPGM